jgi:hypothetical protein
MRHARTRVPNSRFTFDAGFNGFDFMRRIVPTICWLGEQHCVVDFSNELLDEMRMKLSVYLTDRQITPADFAERLGVTAEGVRLWTTGKRRPSALMMQKIVDETGGHVQPNDFYDLRQCRETREAP